MCGEESLSPCYDQAEEQLKFLQKNDQLRDQQKSQTKQGKSEKGDEHLSPRGKYVDYHFWYHNIVPRHARVHDCMGENNLGILILEVLMNINIIKPLSVCNLLIWSMCLFSAIDPMCLSPIKCLSLMDARLALDKPSSG